MAAAEAVRPMTDAGAGFGEECVDYVVVVVVVAAIAV